MQPHPLIRMAANEGLQARGVGGRQPRNRIRAGETLTVPKIALDASNTFGLENLVVIAVKATTKEPLDFSFMAQPTLEKALKQRSVSQGSTAKSPLESLFETSLYGAGSTRGISRRAVEEFRRRERRYGTAVG